MIHDIYAVYRKNNKKLFTDIGWLSVHVEVCIKDCDLGCLGVTGSSTKVIWCVEGYVCVYSTFAVLLPVHNWCCAGNPPFCKWPIFSHTSSHKQKNDPKNRHCTGRINNTDFKVWNSFLWAPPLPLTWLLISFLLSLFSWSNFMLSLLFSSYHTCSLPFALSVYPSPVHHSHLLISASHSFSFLVLILLPHWMFLSNMYQQLPRVSNWLETLVKNNQLFISAHNKEREGKNIGWFINGVRKMCFAPKRMRLILWIFLWSCNSLAS